MQPPSQAGTFEFKKLPVTISQELEGLDSVALDLTSMIMTDSPNSQRLVPLPV